MKPTLALFLLTLAVVFLWNSPHSGTIAAPSASAAPAAGPWTTGAVGTLGDVVYGPGEHYVDLASEGLYDPQLWAVILDYNTLTIQAGATIRFLNHPTRAPVVIRAMGDIIHSGALILDGAKGHNGSEFPVHSEPGPGGFRGGAILLQSPSDASDGHGPGGAFRDSSTATGRGGASHATQGTIWGTDITPGPTYGSGFVAPLVGGSGGTGLPGGLHGGGAGGGAILIGSDSSIVLGGGIYARGGDAGLVHGSTPAAGSGGAIRLASPLITLMSGGNLRTHGGGIGGGDGWSRVETIGTPVGGNIPGVPGVLHDQHLSEFLPTMLPTVTVASWWDDSSSQWMPMGQDPNAVIDDGSRADVRLPSHGLRTLRLEGRSVDIGAPLHVRITDTAGAAFVDSTHTMGEVVGSTLGFSWTDVQVDFSLGVSTVQVRAELP